MKQYRITFRNSRPFIVSAFDRKDAISRGIKQVQPNYLTSSQQRKLLTSCKLLE